MKKTAIFVEGQTELIFVREYLLKVFEYQNIAIECYTLFVDSKFFPTEYAFENENAAYFFQIINVGNDTAVLQRILVREKNLWSQGFHHIIGLRDMYSRNYREVNIDSVGVINPEINAQFIEGTQTEIQRKALHPQRIAFHFAIMETESWILGLANSLSQLDTTLTHAFIYQQLGFDLAIIDPEVVFYHPATILESIFTLIGGSYNKSKGDIYAIMASVEREQFIQLYQSSRCKSFRDFHQTIETLQHEA